MKRAKKSDKKVKLTAIILLSMNKFTNSIQALERQKLQKISMFLINSMKK